MPSSRRSLLKTALVLTAGYGTVKYGAPALADLFAGGFRFAPVAGVEGFRQFDGGQRSQHFDPFIGLDPSTAPNLPSSDLSGRFCQTLFGAAPIPMGIVPIASFSDYNCPYCRRLTQRLVALAARDDVQIRLRWHELPLLGPMSVFAAKAALAARRQGAYAAMHRHFMISPVRPSRSYLVGLAESLELDVPRLLADMDSSAIAVELADSAALAARFGIVGTPALVVGRTRVMGAITDRTLIRLIARERADGPIPRCS